MFAASVFRPIVTARFGLCQNICSETGTETSTEDTLRVFATVGFPALQLNALSKQFVAARKVPKPVSHSCDELSFSWPGGNQ